MKPKFSIFLILLSFVSVVVQAQTNFTATGSLNTARAYQTATLLPNGQALVTGGMDTNGNVLASAELYNPATGTWTTTGSLANARYGDKATQLPNGLVLVTGGDNTGNAFTNCELYNPTTYHW